MKGQLMNDHSSNQSISAFIYLEDKRRDKELVCGASLNTETLQSLVHGEEHGIFVGEVILKQLLPTISLQENVPTR
jgi:hypothetical protein